MLPPKCYTCGKLLADIEIDWENFDRECRENRKTKAEIADLKAKYLDTLHLKDICCRVQVLTYIQLVKIIK